MSITSIVNEVAPLGGVTLMEHAGFSAMLMKAKRLKGDCVHGLPPGQAITVFPIATLPGAPEAWVREAGTYVCPVDAEWGLWFDWRNNSSLNTAIVPSVKGMNPITGQKIEGFGLEAYADKCPVHDIPFSHGRICEECGYEWPPQNYVCAPGELWWDGYRVPEDGGSVRQFFFTDEDERDVASAMIGKENTVPAFGFAFYKTKVNREPFYRQERGHLTSGGPIMYGGMTNTFMTATYNSTIKSGLIGNQISSYLSSGVSEVGCSSVDSIEYDVNVTRSIKPQNIEISERTFLYDQVERNKHPKKSKSVSVGAGAKINQKLEPDNLGLDGWQDEHSGVIRLYFCFEEEFKKIIKNGGVKELKSNPDGYLKNIPVG